MAQVVKKLYYSIGEVSELTGLKPYVLRYWETEFPDLSPSKNRAGNRVYTEENINQILEIKRLLYQEKFTIEGARQFFRNNSESPGRTLKISNSLPDSRLVKERDVVKQILVQVRASLGELMEMIQKEKQP